MGRRIAALLLACMLVPSAALAGEPTEADLKRAKDLFAAATKLETAESYAAALEKLKEVVSIKSTAGVLYHMANCEEQLGKLGDALVHFEQSNEAAIQQGSSDVRGLAPGKIAALKDRAPKLSISVTPPVDGTEVLLDGAAVPADKLKEIRVNPDQEYALQIHAPGRIAIERSVRLKERATEDLRIELKEAANGGAGTPVGPKPGGGDSGVVPPDRGGRSVLPLVVGGAAAAVFLGVGIGMTFAANGKGSDSDVLREKVLTLTGTKESAGQCANPSDAELKSTCDELSSNESDRLTLQGIAIAGYVGAGVALAGGIVWYFVQPAGAKASAIRATPMIGRGSSGLMVTGRF